MINSPVWVTSVSCSENNICFKECYSMDDATLDQQLTCNPPAYVTITCGMYLYCMYRNKYDTC